MCSSKAKSLGACLGKAELVQSLPMGTGDELIAETGENPSRLFSTKRLRNSLLTHKGASAHPAAEGQSRSRGG